MSERNQEAESQAQKIRDKLATSQGRSRRASRASSPGDDAEPRPSPPDPRGLVERTVDDHPLALLAGSLVLGVVAANLLQASFGRRVAARLLGGVAVAGELGAKLGSKTLGAAADAGRAGQDRLSQLGEAVAEEGAEVRRRAAEMSAQARRRALELASEAASEAREKGDSVLKRLGKLARRS